MITLILILLLVLCFLLLFILIFIWQNYNRFILLKNRVKEAWSDIEVLLKRRHDLIPNLVETVKGYVAHERETLEAVIQARNMAISVNKNSIEEQVKSETILTGALKSLFAVSEKYPELKANENFLELQKEIVDTENKIQSARRFFNTNVLALNTKIEMFPSNIVANYFKFNKEKFFELENKNEQKPVNISFK